MRLLRKLQNCGWKIDMALNEGCKVYFAFLEDANYLLTLYDYANLIDLQGKELMIRFDGEDLVLYNHFSSKRLQKNLIPKPIAKLLNDTGVTSITFKRLKWNDEVLNRARDVQASNGPTLTWFGYATRCQKLSKLSKRARSNATDVWAVFVYPDKHAKIYYMRKGE